MPEQIDYTYSLRNLADHLHIQLFVADTLRVGTEWDSRNVQSAYWRFYCNDRDGAWLDLGGRRFDLAGGAMYFVPAGVTFNCCNGVVLEHFYVHFDLVGFPPIVLQELVREPIRVPYDAKLSNAIRRISGALVNAAPANLSLQCRIKSVLYDAFALHLDTLGSDALRRSEERARDLAPVMPALRCIERMIGDRLDNAMLADLCFMSEDHFIRRFRASVGKTPARYITERRVTTAAQQLRFTSSSIDAISEQTGFGNRFYFTRVFKRELGTTPARYRLGDTS